MEVLILTASVNNIRFSAVGTNFADVTTTAAGFTPTTSLDTVDVRATIARGAYGFTRSWLYWDLASNSGVDLHLTEVDQVDIIYRAYGVGDPSYQDGASADSFWIANSSSTAYPPNGSVYNDWTANTKANRCLYSGTNAWYVNVTGTITSALSSQITQWSWGTSTSGALVFVNNIDFMYNLDGSTLYQTGQNYQKPGSLSSGRMMLKFTYSSTAEVDEIDRTSTSAITAINSPPGVALDGINGIQFTDNLSFSPGQLSHVDYFSQNMDSGATPPARWTNGVTAGTGHNLDKWGWVTDSGGTPSSGTGPTEGALDTTYYLFTESTGRSNGTFEIQTNNNYYRDAIDLKLSFYVHMYANAVNTMGALRVYYVPVAAGTNEGFDGITGTPRQLMCDVYDEAGTATVSSMLQLGFETSNLGVVSSSTETTGRIQTAQGDPYRLVTCDLGTAAEHAMGRILFQGLTRHANVVQQNAAGLGISTYWRGDIGIDQVSVSGYIP